MKITTMLPTCVATCSVDHDLPSVALFPEEARQIERAVPIRRAEYTTVRWCARTALNQLGLPEQPIVKAADGAPVWPRHVVGSLTHCRGFRSAAVCFDDQVRSIGIDAEPHAPLPPGVQEAVTVPAEVAHLDQLNASHPETCWDRILFSAKEAVYKAWHPIEPDRHLEFTDALIRFDPAGTFTADLNAGPQSPWRQLAGQWQVESGIIATAVVTV